MDPIIALLMALTGGSATANGTNTATPQGTLGGGQNDLMNLMAAMGNQYAMGDGRLGGSSLPAEFWSGLFGALPSAQPVQQQNDLGSVLTFLSSLLGQQRTAAPMLSGQPQAAMPNAWSGPLTRGMPGGGTVNGATNLSTPYPVAWLNDPLYLGGDNQQAKVAQYYQNLAAGNAPNTLGVDNTWQQQANTIGNLYTQSPLNPANAGMTVNTTPTIGNTGIMGTGMTSTPTSAPPMGYTPPGVGLGGGMNAGVPERYQNQWTNTQPTQQTLDFFRTPPATTPVLGSQEWVSTVLGGRRMS